VEGFPEMKKELMLVTGANGYVGKEVVEQLVAQGIPVRAMVRDLAKSSELKMPGVEIVVADLLDKESLRKAVSGVYGIFHIGAIFRQAGLPESIFHDVNAEGTRTLFELAIEAGVKRIVHCSTGGVLGHVKNPPGSDTSPYNPGDMYQRSKLEGEKIAMGYFKSEKMRGVVIRPAMIYGPADTRNLKLFKMIARKKFFYVGKGEMSVHFVDVRDLASAFLLAMEKEDLNAQIYHIPGERAVPLKEMVNFIADYLEVPRPGLHLPVKPVQLLGTLCEAVCTPFRIQPPIYRRRVDFFTKNRHFDGTKAARELGYKPARRFEDEVKEITDWYASHSWL
jgi:nucleoside-diphosphate-sugar epimerase